MNMIFTGQQARFLQAGGLAAVLLLCACEKVPEAGPSAKDESSLPPAIIAPSEVAGPSERSSYEVGIATAAAERNHAKEKCVDMPQIERETCEAAADASFATAEADLNDLRGNQQ